MPYQITLPLPLANIRDVFHVSQENIVVAQEILHNMNKMKDIQDSFVVKVDLAKAYDNLN